MSASWFADKIEQWPTAKLLPYARNARTHSDEQVAQIAASIAEFGFTNPILAGSDGIIVAGRNLRRAADMVEIIERSAEVILGCYAVGKEPPLLPADAVDYFRKLGDIVA